MQELGRVDLQREDAVDGELVHGRVAGVVRGAHAGEHDAPRAAARVAQGLDGVPLVEEGAGGPPQGVGLAADLGEE